MLIGVGEDSAAYGEEDGQDTAEEEEWIGARAGAGDGEEEPRGMARGREEQRRHMPCARWAGL